MASPHNPPASSSAAASFSEAPTGRPEPRRPGHSAVAEDPSALETPNPKEAHPGWRQLDRRKVVLGFVMLMAALTVVMYASTQTGRSSGEGSQVDIEASEEVHPTARRETEGLLEALARSARETKQTSGATTAERRLGTPGQEAAGPTRAGRTRVQATLDSLQRALRRRLTGLSASGPLPGQGRYQAVLGGPGRGHHPAAAGRGGRNRPSYTSYGALGGPRGPTDPPPGVAAKPIIYKAEVTSSRSSTQQQTTLPARQMRSTPLISGHPRSDPSSSRQSTAGNRPVPLRPQPPRSPFVLRAGTTISAILETAVSSNLPGYVRARVTRDVFDSATQQHLLIPKGSVLQGRQDAQVRTGQKRLALVWERLVLPDGSTIALPTFEAKDGQGRTGVPGEVDNHYFRIFGGALLTGLAGAAVRLATYDREGSLFRRPSPMAITGGAAAHEVGEAADELLRRQINIAPTIRLEAGDPVTVYVSRKITFAGPYRPYDGFAPGN